MSEGNEPLQHRSFPPQSKTHPNPRPLATYCVSILFHAVMHSSSIAAQDLPRIHFSACRYIRVRWLVLATAATTGCLVVWEAQSVTVFIVRAECRPHELFCFNWRCDRCSLPTASACPHTHTHFNLSPHHLHLRPSLSSSLV